MSHVVLLGDSIFDNASYVPGRPAVIDQMRTSLPRGCSLYPTFLILLCHDILLHILCLVE